MAKGLNEIYDALPASERQRHENEARDAKRATDVGGRGYLPTKKITASEMLRKTATDKLDKHIRNCELDRDSTSAASALRSPNLSDSTDFDDGIRVLRRGLRDATTAVVIAERLQRQTLADHDPDSRRNDTVMNNLPPSISDLLGGGLAVRPTLV